MIGTSPEAASLTCTGSLSNIVQYAKASFRKDQDQEKAFIQITAAFVLKLHEKCYNDLNHRRGRGVKRNRNRNAIPKPPINFQNNEEIKALREIMNNKEQFICFLSGAGGTGKSKVIQSVRMYCKQLCQDTLEIAFTKRTIVVTAMTGTAAVNINGETVHKACCLNCDKKNVNPDEEWMDETCLVIVDEISFASNQELEKLNDNLNQLCDTSSSKYFGDLPMVFAGDFSQLKPVGGETLLASKTFALWRQKVNTFLELKTNHRFAEDPEWGLLLESVRAHGLKQEHAEFINRKIVRPTDEAFRRLYYRL